MPTRSRPRATSWPQPQRLPMPLDDAAPASAPVPVAYTEAEILAAFVALAERATEEAERDYLQLTCRAILTLLERARKQPAAPRVLPLPVRAATPAPTPAIVERAAEPEPMPSALRDFPRDQWPARWSAEGFDPSVYQRNIFAWMVGGTGNAIVNAVAGSGKTTTLVRAAEIIAMRRESAIFVAFNVHIREELSERLAPLGMQAATMNSVGMGCVATALKGKKVTVRKHKYEDLALEEVARRVPMLTPEQDAAAKLAARTTADLVRLARLRLVEPSDTAALDDIVEHFGLEVDPRQTALIYGLVPVLFARGERVARELGEIDFTDQLWLPYRWNLQPRQVKWVFVDECQDLSDAQRALSLKLIAPGGRAIYVGDRHQAIYGFAGADAESFARIAAEARCTPLPLTVCYRCPTTHLDRARQIVPEVEARPGAFPGVIADLHEGELVGLVQPGDLIMSRRRLPLMRVCLNLIAHGVKATVRGNDVSEQLVQVIDAVVAMGGYTWHEFGRFLSLYEAAQEGKLAGRKHPESQLEALHDRVSAVRACFESGFYGHVTDAEQFKDAIKSLFTVDDKRDKGKTVDCRTIHGAKGSEANRVFILDPRRIRLAWNGQQDWEAEQEANAEYVALTRARDGKTRGEQAVLTFVYKDAADMPDQPEREDDDEGAGEADREAVALRALVAATGDDDIPF